MKEGLEKKSGGQGTPGQGQRPPKPGEAKGDLCLRTRQLLPVTEVRIVGLLHLGLK